LVELLYVPEYVIWCSTSWTKAGVTSNVTGGEKEVKLVDRLRKNDGRTWGIRQLEAREGGELREIFSASERETDIETVPEWALVLVLNFCISELVLNIRLQ
jgi:hypothetical protein